MDHKKVQELYNLNMERFLKRIRDNIIINNKQTKVIWIINNLAKILSNQIIWIPIINLDKMHSNNNYNITNRISINKELCLHKTRCFQEEEVLIWLTQNKILQWTIKGKVFIKMDHHPCWKIIIQCNNMATAIMNH